MGSESTGNLDHIYLFQAHPLYHELASGVKRTLAQLDLPYIFLCHDDIFINTGLFRPGKHKLRLIGVRVRAKPRVIFQFLLVEHATFRDHTGPVKLGQQVQNSGTANSFGFHIFGLGILAPGLPADDLVIDFPGFRVDRNTFDGTRCRAHPKRDLRPLQCGTRST